MASHNHQKPSSFNQDYSFLNQSSNQKPTSVVLNLFNLSFEAIHKSIYYSLNNDSTTSITSNIYIYTQNYSITLFIPTSQ